jgi:hypothetical protein
MHDIDRSFMETDSEGFEFSNDEEWSGSEVFSEHEVEQLASELLSLSSEDELDHFLGNLIKRAGSAVGKLVKGPLGSQIGSMLKGLASKALPLAGAALGNMIVPGLGGMIGGKLASAAGSAFGLEVEGLSQEDQHFEIAKQFVRLAGDTTKNALAAPGKPPPLAAKDAMMLAAQRFAPGLLQMSAASPGRGNSGRWVRRGNKIVIYGV